MMREIRGIRYGVYSALLLLGFAAAALGPRAADAADAKQQALSRSIAKQIIAAQKAIQTNQFADAIKSLEDAEAVPGLTPFDHKTIDEQKAYCYSKMQNNKAAADALEAALATGAATPEEQIKYNRSLFGMAYNAKQYDRAVEFGKKIVDADAANSEIYTAITQSYYFLKDCKSATVWADKTIAYARKVGEPQKEGIYQLKYRCAFDSGDTPATIAALEDLVRLTDKSDYWMALLQYAARDEKDDHNLLMIYRLMYNTNSMNSGGTYVEMAQLLADAPVLPGEAEAVLEKGLASGTISPDQKDRAARLETSLKTRADADRKGLPEFAAEATKSGAGDLSVKLGEVYYGFGQYQDAVNAITSGLQKGGVRHLDDAYVYLGLAQQGLKNIPEAKKAFAQLKTVPNMPPKFLNLWLLYAEKLG